MKSCLTRNWRGPGGPRYSRPGGRRYCLCAAVPYGGGSLCLIAPCPGGEAAQVERALDGVLGLEAEIVRRGPEPEAGDLAGVARAGLGARRTRTSFCPVAARFEGESVSSRTRSTWLAAEGFFKGGDFDGMLEFDGDREGVAVENRGGDDLERERRPGLPASAVYWRRTRASTAPD